MREVRIITSRSRLKRSSGGPPSIEGYAATWNDVTAIDGAFGSFREVVRRGAFTRSLREGADVRCLFNHEPSLILGRVKSKTLLLSEDATGLHFRCTLPNTTQARDLHESIDRGDVDGCSFGFQVGKQNWIEEKQGNGNVVSTRELLDVSLFDVGPVTFPAYGNTGVDVRAAVLFPEGIPAEIRSRGKAPRVWTPAQMKARVKALMYELNSDPPDESEGDDVEPECTCPCASCTAGNCSACDCSADCEGCGGVNAPAGEDERGCHCASTRSASREFQRRFQCGPFATEPRMIIPGGSFFERLAQRETDEKIYAARVAAQLAANSRR